MGARSRSASACTEPRTPCPITTSGRARFKAASGLALLAVLALRRGLLDPATLGGAACARRDLEPCCPYRGPAGVRSTPLIESRDGIWKAAFLHGRSWPPQS